MLNNYSRQIKLLSVQVNPKITAAVLLFTYVLCLVATYITLVHPGKSYITTWLNDVMGFIDIANRVSLGELPYKDFHFGYGPLVALIPGVALFWSGNAGTIFAVHGLMVSSVLLFSALILLPRRLTTSAALLVFLFAWLLIAIPMANMQSFKDITWGAFYNRQGWAALIIIFVLYIEPVRTGAWSKWLDAVALALLFLFELGNKLPFAMVALGFILMNSIISRYNRQVSLRSLVIVVLVVIVEEIFLGLGIPYWHSILAVSASLKSGRLGIWDFATILIDNAPIILGSLGAVMAAKAVGRHSVFDWFYAAGVIISVVLLLTTIGAGSGRGGFAIFIVFIIFGELARRAEAEKAKEKEKEKTFSSQTTTIKGNHIVSLGCLFIAAAFIATESGNRLLAWQDFAVKVRKDAVPSNTPSRLSQILIPDWDKLKHASIGISSYMKTIADGTNLLVALEQPEKTVLTFDMVNPFPYAAGMKPPANGYPLFWLGGAVSSDPDLLPSPKDFVGSVDYVMVPRLPYDQEQFEIRMKLYGEYLKQNYSVQKESASWYLWKRKDVGSSAHSNTFQISVAKNN